jgi:hypothetical protein
LSFWKCWRFSISTSFISNQLLPACKMFALLILRVTRCHPY